MEHVSRRALVSAVMATAAQGALTVPLSAAPSEGADAALLAMGPEVEALVCARDVASSEHSRREAIWFQRCGGITQEEVEEAYRCQREADNALLHATGRIAETPATTLEGLIFKARLCDHDDELAEAIVRDLLALGRGR